jgi:hypothetical protein
MPEGKPTALPLRRRVRRIAGCLVAAAGLLVGASVAVAPATAAAPVGYRLSDSRIVGEAPGGFRIYLSPSAPHRAAISPLISATAGNLRSFGLQVTYAGYGRPAHARGIITVSEGSRGCAGGSSVLANTYWYYGAMRGGGYYMYRSDIVICPSRFVRSAAWQRAAIVRHEFGHAMGLGHMNTAYRGLVQIMSSYTHHGVSMYRPGDIAGLRRLAAGAARVRRYAY